jgi:hypothetical protein
MEFTIDLVTVMKIAREEGQLAKKEINDLGPLIAYQRSTQRHDERLAQAPDAQTLDCKAGCAWCCSFSVDLRPVEAFNILQRIENTFNNDEKQQLRSEMSANSAILSGLDDLQRMRQTIKCPFLVENQCSIYEARPQTCRNYHATNSAGCQQSYEEPNNLEIPPDFASGVYQAGGAHVEAFSKAMQTAGYDSAAYELNSAMLELMADPDSVRLRFDAKLPVFFSVEGTDVTPELIEE